MGHRKHSLSVLVAIALGFSLLTAGSLSLRAQYAKRIIQFSGLIVGGDSLYGIAGAALYVPKAGRGTITNEVGFFSMPLMLGDSVVISSLGYKKKSYKIPFINEDKLTVIIELKEDTIMFPVVEIFPYPTEEAFKQAFLNLRTNEPAYYNMRKNYDPELMHKMTVNAQMNAYENQSYYLQQQSYRQGNRYMAPAGNISLLNPFAWASFIKSVRSGAIKRGRDNIPDDDDE